MSIELAKPYVLVLAGRNGQARRPSCSDRAGQAMVELPTKNRAVFAAAAAAAAEKQAAAQTKKNTDKFAKKDANFAKEERKNIANEKKAASAALQKEEKKAAAASKKEGKKAAAFVEKESKKLPKVGKVAHSPKQM